MATNPRYLLNDLAKRKACLLSYGRIEIPKDTLTELSVERPKTGPSSGKNVIGFEFNGRRVKLVLSRERERFALEKNEKGFVITKDGEEFLRVKPLDLRYHAPNQLFVSLGNKCIYSCLFCKRSDIVIPEEKLISYARKALDTGKVNSLSITSGVFPSTEKHVEAIEKFIKEIRKDYPTISIGVEPVVESREHISALYSAGADEIKINVQAATKELFDMICGYMDYDKILSLLQDAVDIFGREKVTSNVIYGMGESDDDVVGAVERLADLGVVANLRMLRRDAEIERRFYRAAKYIPESVNPDRIIRLALLQKEILRKRNLSTRHFKTMCFACGCCDIVPFWDI